jgi:3-phosphoshikimate 1-carboxyvinyltransferase
MLSYSITAKGRKLSGEVSLAPSKSISNRSIVVMALKNSKLDIKSISEKDAAKLFDKSMSKGKVSFEKGQPALAIRFLRAFLAYFDGEWIITGSADMHKRPICDVIKKLSEEGINIKYLQRDGFPPLKVIGKGLKGSINRVDATICSQFVTVSMLISPTCSTDEVVKLKNWILNSPYIKQTIRLLGFLGINTNWNMQELLVEHQLHDGTEMTVEPDWLSASYWYELAALSKGADIKINGLNPDSVQSDAIVKELFEPLGVKTIKTDKGVALKKGKKIVKTLEYDFSNNPDLVPTMVVTCVALNIPFRFTGIEVLREKDSDRIMALQTQMSKLGAKICVEKRKGLEVIQYDGKSKLKSKTPLSFTTFGDHRIAMSLAPLSVLGLDVVLDEPKSVSKSYPCYWEDFKKLGFVIGEVKNQN